MGNLVGVSGPQCGWLLGPALCGFSWLLVGQTDHKTASCRAQRVLELVLAHRWAESGSVIGGCTAKGPRYSVSLFMNWTGP